jgi:hypothetical protein
MFHDAIAAAGYGMEIPLALVLVNKNEKPRTWRGFFSCGYR